MIAVMFLYLFSSTFGDPQIYSVYEECYFGYTCSAEIVKCITNQPGECPSGTAFRPGLGCTNQGYSECCISPNLHPSNRDVLTFDLTKSGLQRGIEFVWPSFVCLAKNSIIPETPNDFNNRTGKNCGLTFKDSEGKTDYCKGSLYDAENGTCHLTLDECCPAGIVDLNALKSLGTDGAGKVVDLLAPGVVCPALVVKNPTILFHKIHKYKHIVNNTASLDDYVYGLDIYSETSDANFRCIKFQKYTKVWLEVYNEIYSGGIINSNFENNANLAIEHGINIEAYLTLCNMVNDIPKTVEKVLPILSMFNVSKVWLTVTLPLNWSQNAAKNIKIIQDFIDEIKIQNDKMEVGIMSGWYDWLQITDSSTAFSSNYTLGYWLTSGRGPRTESKPDFADYDSFGKWETPTLKLYGMTVENCGIVTNRLVEKN